MQDACEQCRQNALTFCSLYLFITLYWVLPVRQSRDNKATRDGNAAMAHKLVSYITGFDS